MAESNKPENDLNISNIHDDDDDDSGHELDDGSILFSDSGDEPSSISHNNSSTHESGTNDSSLFSELNSHSFASTIESEPESDSGIGYVSSTNNTSVGPDFSRSDNTTMSSLHSMSGISSLSSSSASNPSIALEVTHDSGITDTSSDNIGGGRGKNKLSKKRHPTTKRKRRLQHKPVRKSRKKKHNKKTLKKTTKRKRKSTK